MACGIVLSGGLSRRFQRPGTPWVDKALYSVDGKPMIMRVIETAGQILDELIIAVNNEERVSRYREVLPGVKYVIDDASLRGPLAGIYSGLRACGDEYAVVLPNDMPYITPRSIELLMKHVRNFDAVTYVLPNGHITNALMALRRSVALEILSILSGMGRSKVFDILRGSPTALFLSPEAHGIDVKALININTREDLSNVSAVVEGFIKSDVSIIRGFSMEDVRSGNTQRLAGSLWYTVMTGDYLPEFRLYTEAGLLTLSAHVLLDSSNENTRALGRLILRALGVEKA